MVNAQPQSFQTGHIGLNVSDLAQSLEFYRKVFGFEIKGESRESGRAYAFLGDEGRLVLTLWQQADGKFEKRRPGLHHLSFQVSDIQKVREAERQLRALNVSILHDGIVPHGEGTQSGGIFFEDPDGIRLEIFSPTGAGGEAPTPGAPSCGFF